MQSNFQKNNIEQLEKSENSNSNSESIQNGIEECSVVEEEEEEEEFKPYLYDDEYTLEPDITAEKLKEMIAEVKKEIKNLESELQGSSNAIPISLTGSESEFEIETFEVPPHCVPIRCDVRYFDWSKLYEETQFDVIVMDPPWQLASSAPTRGVALGYKQLPNSEIEKLPIPKLQNNGFIFIWVINARYSFAIELMEKWGYEVVDDITWVKSTVNRRLAKGHGFYLQHAKETCLVGKKGKDPPGMQTNISSDVIFSERRGQSQKPEEMYELIEKLVPNGRYLEIFARRNNLRNYWVSIGIEL